MDDGVEAPDAPDADFESPLGSKSDALSCEGGGSLNLSVSLDRAEDAAEGTGEVEGFELVLGGLLDVAAMIVTRRPVLYSNICFSSKC